MYHYRVLVSEVDGRQIASQDLLCFYGMRASAVHIRGLDSEGLGVVVEQRIELQIGIIAAIGRQRGKLYEEKT